MPPALVTSEAVARETVTVVHLTVLEVVTWCWFGRGGSTIKYGDSKLKLETDSCRYMRLRVHPFCFHKNQAQTPTPIFYKAETHCHQGIDTNNCSMCYDLL